VIPGLELTYDDPDPAAAAHAVAIGLREFVGVGEGLDAALACARSLGAALIAAHPYTVEQAARTNRGTGRFGADPGLADAVDRYELFNRQELFAWVAEAGLPSVATGDVHRREHLATWKTLLPCAKDERSVLAYLRSPRPAYVVNLAGAAAAA
jgi:processive 1,2-diacylglycerol beta-glucosyltransferase